MSFKIGSLVVYCERFVTPLVAPVHIITGSAGCQEGRDHFLNDEPKWSAFRSQDFGYTKFKAFNTTHLYMEQVSVDLHGQVIDSMWLVKNKTVPFTNTHTTHN
uniref:SFRICE_000476 n=1 Tax=Spodoptera frugiperda TaxID=7108 RepID=A0A2H1V715_SPOFR